MFNPIILLKVLGQCIIFRFININISWHRLIELSSPRLRVDRNIFLRSCSSNVPITKRLKRGKKPDKKYKFIKQIDEEFLAYAQAH